MTVRRAKHLTVDGTEVVEFTERHYIHAVTNLDESAELYAAFDDGGDAGPAEDETYVVLPRTTRTFDLRGRPTKSVSVYTASSVEAHVEALA